MSALRSASDIANQALRYTNFATPTERATAIGGAVLAVGLDRAGIAIALAEAGTDPDKLTVLRLALTGRTS